MRGARSHSVHLQELLLLASLTLAGVGERGGGEWAEIEAQTLGTWIEGVGRGEGRGPFKAARRPQTRKAFAENRGAKLGSEEGTREASTSEPIITHLQRRDERRQCHPAPRSQCLRIHSAATCWKGLT